MLQRPADRREGEIGPRDFVPAEQTDLETLRPCRDGLVQQPRAKDQLHLADPRNVIDREEPLDLDPGVRLLPSLALGSGTRRLVELEIAGRQGPIAVTRL